MQQYNLSKKLLSLADQKIKIYLEFIALSELPAHFSNEQENILLSILFRDLNNSGQKLIIIGMPTN